MKKISVIIPIYNEEGNILRLLKDLINELSLRGHKINYPAPMIGGGQIILIDPKENFLIGASDWRKDGYAIGF